MTLGCIEANFYSLAYTWPSVVVVGGCFTGGPTDGCADGWMNRRTDGRPDG